jgi:hypothetical protein
MDFLFCEHEWEYIQKRRSNNIRSSINEKVSYVFEVSPGRVLMYTIDEDDEMNHLVPEDEYDEKLKYWRSDE